MRWVREPGLLMTLVYAVVAYVLCKAVSAVLNGFATRIGEQAAEEGLDHTPALAEWIVKASVRLLPAEHRGRYLQEFLAELDWKREKLGENAPLSLLAEAVLLAGGALRMAVSLRWEAIWFPGPLPTLWVGPIGNGMLFLLVIGHVLGGGVYTLISEVAARAGGAMWAAFLGALALALVTASSLTELSTKYPTAGGVGLYALKAFKRPSMEFMAMYVLATANIAVLAVNARVVSGRYLAEIVNRPLPVGLVAPVLVLILGLVSFRRVTKSTKAIFVGSVLIEVSGLLLIIGIGVVALLHGVGTPSSAPHTTPVTEAGNPLFGVLGGATLAFYALIGFENFVGFADETKDPAKGLPRALLGGALFAGVIYVLVSLVAGTVVGAGRLGQSDRGLLEVVEVAGMPIPPRVFSAIALVAVTNTAWLSFIIASRLLYRMTRKGIIPSLFGGMHAERHTRLIVIGFVSMIAIALTLTGGVSTLGDTAVLLLLVVFAAMHVAVLKLRADPVAHGHFRVPSVVPIVGLALCIVLLFTQLHPETLVRAALLLLLGVGLWLANLMTSRRRPE
ncbi:MAG: APC family permease [Egibacteraceae bacterium]